MLMLLSTTPSKLPPTFSTICLARMVITCGYLRYWITNRAMSTSLAKMEASLTPMMGGESKNTKS